MSVGTSPVAPPSAVRAWVALVLLSWQRQFRSRQMVWIALGLLALAVGFVALQTGQGRWSMYNWRWRQWFNPTYREWMVQTAAATGALPPTPARGGLDAVRGAVQAALDRSEFYVFSTSIVFTFYLSFLLPLWSLAFATEAFGGEREGGNLIWLLTRPLNRPAIYLAKFAGMLPWALLLNVGGFGLMCLVAGAPGTLAFRLYWPAVVAGTFAFAALFHLMGACFRRAAIIAIVYSFFLEVLLGNMPGYLKRVSLGFYTRCLMFDSARDYGMQADRPGVYLPVSGSTAWVVLVVVTVGLLALGASAFRRMEYQDLS